MPNVTNFGYNSPLKIGLQENGTKELIYIVKIELKPYKTLGS